MAALGSFALVCTTGRALVRSVQNCHDFQRDVKDRFCLECGLGVVSRESFGAGGDHQGHTPLKLYRSTRTITMIRNDLNHILSHDQIDHIQKYSIDDLFHCKVLGPRNPLEAPGHPCYMCGLPITPSSVSIPSTKPSCSVECEISAILWDEWLVGLGAAGDRIESGVHDHKQ